MSDLTRVIDSLKWIAESMEQTALRSVGVAIHTAWGVSVSLQEDEGLALPAMGAYSGV